MTNAAPSTIRRSARVEARKQRTRAAILEAAAELFTRRGYEATTMQEIATLADIGLGTMYGYFPSKEDVLRTVLEERRQHATASITEAVAAARTTPEKIHALLDNLWLHLHENRPLALALFAIEAAKPEATRGDQSYRAMVELLRHGQSRNEIGAVPVETTARALLSVYYVSALQLGIWRDVEDAQAGRADLAALTRQLLRV
jgi:AcrR family transcriptional regulator